MLDPQAIARDDSAAEFKGSIARCTVQYVQLSLSRYPARMLEQMRRCAGYYEFLRQRATRVTHLIAFCFIRMSHVNRACQASFAILYSYPACDYYPTTWIN